MKLFISYNQQTSWRSKKAHIKFEPIILAFTSWWGTAQPWVSLCCYYFGFLNEVPALGNRCLGPGFIKQAQPQNWYRTSVIIVHPFPNEKPSLLKLISSAGDIPKIAQNGSYVFSQALRSSVQWSRMAIPVHWWRWECTIDSTRTTWIRRFVNQNHH